MTQTIPERDWADASGGRVNAVLAPTRMHVANAIKTVAYRTGLHRTLFYRYDYMFRPAQLSFLVSCLTTTGSLPGPVLEIGCAGGNTTVFLNEHLKDLEDARKYICIDTFAGFTDEDIAVEVSRGKDMDVYKQVFRAYQKNWFDATMSNNKISRVTSIQADVNLFDFSGFEQISFCLIDVDLTRPVQRALEEVLPRMASGGIIAVDDCKPNNEYDGALSAYLDIVKAHDYPVDIRHGKIGVITVR